MTTNKNTSLKSVGNGDKRLVTAVMVGERWIRQMDDLGAKVSYSSVIRNILLQDSQYPGVWPLPGCPLDHNEKAQRVNVSIPAAYVKDFRRRCGEWPQGDYIRAVLFRGPGNPRNVTPPQASTPPADLGSAPWFNCPRPQSIAPPPKAPACLPSDWEHILISTYREHMAINGAVFISEWNNYKRDMISHRLSVLGEGTSLVVLIGYGFSIGEPRGVTSAEVPIIKTALQTLNTVDNKVFRLAYKAAIAQGTLAPDPRFPHQPPAPVTVLCVVFSRME